MPTITLTHSSDANFSESGGFDQECFNENDIRTEIMNHYEVENSVLQYNDQGFDSDCVIKIKDLWVTIDDMSDPSSVDYTIHASCITEESESEWDDDSEG